MLKPGDVLKQENYINLDRAVKEVASELDWYLRNVQEDDVVFIHVDRIIEWIDKLKNNP